MWIVDKGGELLKAESLDEIQMGTDDWQNNEELKDPPPEKKVWFLYAVRLNPYKHIHLTEINLTRSEAEAGLKRIRQALDSERQTCNPLIDPIDEMVNMMECRPVPFFEDSDK